MNEVKKNIFNMRYSKLVITNLGILFIFLLWFIIYIVSKNGAFPSISNTFGKLGYLLGNYRIYEATGYTFLRLIISFAFTFLLAGILGTLSGLFHPLKSFLSPLLLVFRTIPTAALILIMIVLFKNQITLFLVQFLIIFPIMFEAFASGVSSIDRSYIRALSVDGKPYSLNSIFKVILPMAKSYIVLGMIQSLGLSMKISVMAEIMVGSSQLKGLGMMLNSFYLDADMAGVFAVAIISILIISILEIVLNILKKRFATRN